MGIDYFLIDKKNKTFFELGRGNWHSLGHDKDCISDLGKLQDCLLSEVFSYYGHLTDRLHYHVSEHLTDEIFNNFGNTPKEYLEVISDCSDAYGDMRRQGYRCIGTRYEVRGTQEWHDIIGYYDQKPEPA
jgi:hypothetical protein